MGKKKQTTTATVTKTELREVIKHLEVERDGHQAETAILEQRLMDVKNALTSPPKKTQIERAMAALNAD